MGSAGSDVIIDIDQEWINSLQKKIDDVSLRKHSRAEPPTIFRVPANMRAADPAAYKPKFVSLGPYHRHDPTLKHAENLKYRYLQKLLSRNQEVRFEDLAKLMKELETRARASYAEDIDMGSDEFSEMMLFDGCFIVELLFMQSDRKESNYNSIEFDDEEEEEEDPVVKAIWTLPLIEYDMLMLENQIPFFVIGRIYDLITDERTYPGTMYYELTTLAQAFFDDYLLEEENIVPSAKLVPKFYHRLPFLPFLYHAC